MAIGEVILGAFLNVLFDKLASADLIKLARYVGIYSELDKWKNTLIQIQAVLVDAGQKHLKDKSVQIWLNNLHHLAYEIDDVLDDLATEAAHRRLKQESSPNTSNNTSKVLKFIPNKLHDLKYGRKMSSKLDEITRKLHDLIEQKNLLGLSTNVEMVNDRRLEVTSMVNVSEVIGREYDKEVLLRMLLDGESSSRETKNFKVVSIVGLGGIGKSTLAQLLYNDKEVKKHFQLMAWVCVSDDFHEYNISKSIFQAVGGGNQDFANLDLLQRALSERLSNKKFLIVLDDVWNKIYSKWQLLQGPFNNGSFGSKVLMTTRNVEVAKMMDSIQMHSLKLLSDKEALSLFAQHASGNQSFDVNRILSLHGEDIVKKCGSLPLALRTLGRVFRKKSTYEECEKLLNSEIWNLDDVGEIPKALKLSYHDLPPHLKQIFAYCSLFPKDYKFQKEELVMLWMAEGFLHRPNSHESMEDLGGEYFEELVSRSFYQHLTKSKSEYIMHDLMHDLATKVGGEFFLFLDDKMDVYNRHEALKKVHHLSFIHEKDTMDRKVEVLQSATHLRTFLAMGKIRSRYESYVSNKIVIELTHQLQFLRVFSLAGCSIREVPPSIGRLKHLRYLNFSYTKILCLPEQVGDLHNLQSLLLSYCMDISSLPNSIKQLINLRHLDIAYTTCLHKMPLGLGKLTCLQTLSKVIIGGAGECRISDLKDLVHLQGQLSIEGLHKVKDALHAKEANLQQKRGIFDLQLEWSNIFDGSRNETTEYKVLEGLRPFEKLRKLEIKYYNGTKIPSWVGEPAFDCLTEIMLYNCKNCECLPTLGQLPSLQRLMIKKMDGLKRVGSEFLRPSNTCHGVAFPSLEVLEFEEIEEWEEWSASDGDKDVEAFPCFRKISIISCHNLKSFPHEHLTSLASLEEMQIVDCPSMDDSFPCGMWPPNLSKLRIGDLKKPISEWGMQNFPSSLVSLSLYGSNSGGVISFAKAQGEKEDMMTSSSLLLPLSLTFLYINNFKELESVSEGLQHLTCLRKLHIRGCPKLKDLPERLLPSLERLKLYGPLHPQLEKRCRHSRKGKYWLSSPKSHAFLCQRSDHQLYVFSKIKYPGAHHMLD